MAGIIEEGHKVLIRMPSNNCKIIHLKSANLKITLGKFGQFNAASLIGQPFNAAYDILPSGELEMVDPTESIDITIDAEEDAGNNNSYLVARTDSQKLSKEDIEQRKQEALDGHLDSKALIKDLVENSTSFEGKTAFAKQKYIRRKERKFSKKFEALEPSARNLCEYYFTTKPQKTRGVRIDTLSQLMCLGNVMANSNILVSDSVGGLLVGGLLERMTFGDMDLGGRLFALLDGDSPNFDVVKDMNFKEGVVDRVLDTLPWTRIDPSSHEVEPLPTPDSTDEAVLLRHAKRVESIAKANALRAKLSEAAFDGLILASQFDPLETIERLAKYVGYSRPVVVFSQYKETLVPAYLMMRASPDYLNAQISETMTREYQVPVSGLGTHPFMQASGSGGFILTATRVFAGDCAAASNNTSNKHAQPTKRRKL